MPTPLPTHERQRFAQGHPVITYFTLTYLVSWTGAFLLVAPKIWRGQPVPKLDGLLMFPVMLMGPSFVGIILTRIVDGKTGLRDLFRRMWKVQFPAVWFAAILIPPACIFLVLLILKAFVSPVFAPNHFWIGASFGIAAGFFEEIGWMGFAFPKMNKGHNALAMSILLGILWGIWHVPVIDYLGTSVPHGAYWLHYFLAFTAAMTAMRVLIAWTYSNTRSVLLTQLMHISLTGSLVVFSPTQATAGQEVFWYMAYAVALWVIVVVVVAIFGSRSLSRAA